MIKPMPSQPNILLIILDTQRRDRLSLYGHEIETSPNFDAFAQDAAIFQRAIAPAQWTIPAHASMFTGQYVSTHQLTQTFQRLSPAYPTLAEILQLADYHTVAFCNNPLLGVLDHGLQRGFDAFYNYAGASPNRPVDTTRSPVRRQMVSWFRRLAQQVTNQFATNDWLFRVSLNPFVGAVWTRFVNFKGDTERSIDDFVDYWGQHHAGGTQKPIFAFVNLMGTHTPYRPPATYLDQVAPGLRHNKSVSRFMARHNADAAEWLSPDDPPLQDWQRHTLDAFYNAEIVYQDKHLGRLLNYLKRSGSLENTMVIIAADHGEGHGDHGFKGHSFVVYQELVHVPLIIRYPDQFPQGKQISKNISTRRIFHTILDITASTAPLAADDPNADVTGLSLVSALNGKPDSENGVVFAEAFPPLNLLKILNERKPEMVERLQLKQVRRGIYDGDHKLATIGNQTDSLFDVADDPGEEQNLAPDNPAVVDDLHNRINQFVRAAQSSRSIGVDNGDVSDEVIENLRALGYID